VWVLGSVVDEKMLLQMSRVVDGGDFEPEPERKPLDYILFVHRFVVATELAVLGALDTAAARIGSAAVDLAGCLVAGIVVQAAQRSLAARMIAQRYLVLMALRKLVGQRPIIQSVLLPRDLVDIKTHTCKSHLYIPTAR
jgi:hypothetical protein